MKIGIIGTGRIAKRFVPEALSIDQAEITAVFNPHKESAGRFVREVCKELPVIAAADPEEFWEAVDGVYIASPHETHYGYIIQCLEQEKHVLCEKPMVLKRAEAEECFRLAAEKKLVLMEGIKTAYCPGYRKLLEVTSSGIIGDIEYIDSCFTKLEDTGRRELTDLEYGGSFTELGSYILLPVFDLFGSDYDSVRFSKIDNALGLDIFTKVDMDYRRRFASALCGLGVKSEGRLMIGGTKGYVKADAPWWKTSHIEVHFEDPAKIATYDVLFEGDGLRYEIAEFIRRTCSCDDKTSQASSDRSIAVADLMERFLGE